MGSTPSASAGRAIGVIVLVFLSGLATGYLGFNLVEPLSPDRDTEFRIESTLADLSTNLELNPSQMEQIRVVLDDAIMEEAELLNELKWNQKEARERIMQYLTPEQSEQFMQMLDIAFQRQ